MTDIADETAIEEDEEEEASSEKSVIIDVDNEFNVEGFKIPSGARLPRSAPDLAGLSEGHINRALQGFSDGDIEDLFNKSTESFRCLQQVLISRSSLLRQILYHFPELTDPGIDEAFNYVEPEPQYDNVGTDKYQSLCRDMGIVPLSRVIRSLETDTLNLKYYGLSDKQWKAIASCIMFNTHIKHLILQDNWLSPESAVWLGEMLRENNSIQVLNVRECRLGPKGIRHCVDGFGLSQSLRELDLSCNDLGDEGVAVLAEALRDNPNIEKLSLAHNSLGEASGKLLGDLMKEPNSIDFLDLSWNDLYAGKAIKYLCDGLAKSTTLKYLNLSWNGIGTPDAVAPIVKYLKGSQVIEHLDLSFNRLVGKLIVMMKAALLANNSLTSVNLGFNLITPQDAITLTSVFKRSKPLEYMDLQNVFVDKQFLPIWKKLINMEKNVRIEGVLDNYTIVGPNKVKVVFDRCRYLAQKPKKKKQKKDFGSHFIWSLPDEVVDIVALRKLVKKAKIKLDPDLVDFLGDSFSRKKKRIELKCMRDAYLELYPDTLPPPPPTKQKGKKRAAKKKAGDSKLSVEEARPSTQEKAIGTDPSTLTQRYSSLVTAGLQPQSIVSLPRPEPSEPEQVVSTVNLDTPHEPADRRSVTLVVPAVKTHDTAAPPPESTAAEAESIVRDSTGTDSDKQQATRDSKRKSKSTVVFLDEIRHSTDTDELI